MSCEERLRERGYKYLMGVSEEGETSLYSGAQWGKTTTDKHKTRNPKQPTNQQQQKPTPSKRQWAETGIQEIPCKYTVSLVKSWQVAKKDLGVSILESSKNLNGHGPEQPAETEPALSSGVGQGDVQRSLTTLVIPFISYPYPCLPDPNIHSDLVFMKHPSMRIHCLHAVWSSPLCSSQAKRYSCMIEMLKNCEGIC